MPIFKKKTHTKHLALLRTWMLPAIVIITLTCFVVISAKIYLRNEAHYRLAKSEQVAQEIGRVISSEIWQRVTVLKILGKDYDFFAPGNDEYSTVATNVVNEYPDFFAINLINKSGEIFKVYPFEKNKAALGRNLLDRSLVKEYLIEARNSGEARMTPLLMTFQRVLAFTLYVPLYDHKHDFKGWLNGVVDFNSWIKNYVHTGNLDQAYIHIHWIRPESLELVEGSSDVPELFTYEYQILNQKLVIEVGFHPTTIDHDRERNYTMMISVGVILLLLITVFVVELTLSRERARKVNSYLALKNSLLSSLTHDISGPLMVLAINFERAKSSTGLTDSQKERIEFSLKTMEDMLKNARYLHAQELGVMDIKNEPVGIKSALADAFKLVTEQIQKKRLKFDIPEIPKDIFVQADPATLSNNILLNALTNAIKFSPMDGLVKVIFILTPEHVELVFEDQGRGFSERQIKAYRNISNLNVEEGSSGERGTGLGLLQIRTLLNFYGGSLRLENARDQGARAVLIFKRMKP